MIDTQDGARTVNAATADDKALGGVPSTTIRHADLSGPDGEHVGRLIGAYLRQTEREKAEHLKLEPPTDEVPESYRAEVQTPAQAFADAPESAAFRPPAKVTHSAAQALRKRKSDVHGSDARGCDQECPAKDHYVDVRDAAICLSVSPGAHFLSCSAASEERLFANELLLSSLNPKGWAMRLPRTHKSDQHLQGCRDEHDEGDREGDRVISVADGTDSSQPVRVAST